MIDFRNIFKRIFSRNMKNIPKSTLEILIENGHLRVGNNSNIEGLQIHTHGLESGTLNIEIGDDCYLMGSISLYSSKAKVKIGDRVFIAPNSTIFCYDNIEIENDVMFSWGCTVIDTNAHSLNSEERLNDVLDWKKGWEFKNWSVVESKPILIKKKSWIGFNSLIMKGVILNEGAIVASGSVVTKEVESYSIVGGNPAFFIKKTT